jgi:glycogen(starch) synthase
MRVLFWSETFWPRIGGVENLAARLLPDLRARGHEFTVVTWENLESPDVIDYRGIPVYRFPFFSGGGNLGAVLESRRRVANLKRGFAPDLVHVNSYGGSVLFHVNTAAAHPAPSVVTLHQALPDAPIGSDSLLRNVLHSAAWVTACSASVLDSARRLIPEIARRSSVILNGITVSPRAAPPIRFDPPLILCLGRLVKEKGFDLALAAFSVVHQRFPMARLLVAGDGAERKNLLRQADDLGLASAVDFPGAVGPDDVPGLIAQSSLVLVPSRVEGFGLVALEAASMARPVIASRVGGLAEVVVHERTGLLTESENSEALAAAVVRLLGQPEQSARLGLAARERVETEFTWKRHVNAYDYLYRTLVQSARENALTDSRKADSIPR